MRPGLFTKSRVIVVLVLFLIGATVVIKLSSIRSFQLFGKFVCHVDCSDKVVALTFDDGPSEEFTDEVLNILKKCNASATFFVTGAETEKNIDKARKIVAEGHELGNHSYSHSRLIFKLPSTIYSEIEKTDAVIKSAGCSGPIHFRPPYGKRLVILPWILEQMNKTTVMWNIEPETYPEIAASAEKITEHVISRTSPGSIILLHVMYKSREESRKAIPMIVSRLKEKGYSFATVTDLLAKASGHSQ